VVNKTCELCGYRSQLGDIEEHHTIPVEVTEQAGMPPSQTLRLCSNCHREVHKWYSAKVSDIAYDLTTKRFKAKSYPEMVEEYQSAFNHFVKYKNKQKKTD